MPSNCGKISCCIGYNLLSTSIWAIGRGKSNARFFLWTFIGMVMYALMRLHGMTLDSILLSIREYSNVEGSAIQSLNVMVPPHQLQGVKSLNDQFLQTEEGLPEGVAPTAPLCIVTLAKGKAPASQRAVTAAKAILFFSGQPVVPCPIAMLPPNTTTDAYICM